MLLIVATLLVFFFSFCIFWLRQSDGKKRVSIVVMGDIGRSPRMQYHASSFAKNDWNVVLIGYGGSVPHKEVVRPNIILKHVCEFPKILSGLPRSLVYVIKATWQAVSLTLALLLSHNPQYILIQNPPGVPGLAVCWLISRLRGSHLVIDWHNYGHTILAMAAGDQHIFVKFSKWFEGSFGRLADANICVTQAMRRNLEERFAISAVTMYDRAPQIFCRTPDSEQHDLYLRLAQQHAEFSHKSSPRSTAFTTDSGDKRRDRPALIVSSTSWTEDEDFSILLDALEGYEDIKHLPEGALLPSILCVITGKGPQKAYYQEIIKQKEWKYISICTPWLEAEDYPKLLGSADLGVCLHLSSSGLDLPMKVVDMFGCALPVCAIHFNCLHELVQHGVNGMVFHSSQELTSQMQTLLRDFPDGCEQLTTLRDNLKDFQNTRWDDMWSQNVLPLFTKQ